MDAWQKFNVLEYTLLFIVDIMRCCENQVRRDSESSANHLGVGIMLAIDKANAVVRIFCRSIV